MTRSEREITALNVLRVLRAKRIFAEISRKFGRPERSDGTKLMLARVKTNKNSVSRRKSRYSVTKMSLKHDNN